MPIGIYARKSLAERFSEAVAPSSEGCALWQKGKDRKGYGKMWVLGKEKRATHVCWFLATGVWPSTLVLHRCDTPSCVLKSHLFLGSISDNMRDKVEKHRQALGEHVGTARLTSDQVAIIRASSLSLKRLANLLNVHPTTIWHVRTYRTWKHIHADI